MTSGGGGSDDRRPKSGTPDTFDVDSEGRDDDIVLDYRVRWRVIGNSGAAPERRCWHAATIAEPYMYVSGGYSGFTYYGDVHAFDLVRRCWCPAASGELMRARYAHSAVAVGGALYVFGGARERQYFKFFQALPLDPGAFSAAATAVTPDVMAVSGGFGAVTAKGGPTERAAHAVAVCDGVLYVFGGDAGKGMYFSDVHAFNPRTRTWTMLHPKGTPPSARGWCTLSCVGRKLYLIFGTNGSDVYNDVHCLNLDTNTWSKVATHGADPIGRHSHSACVYGDLIYVYGGVGERKRQVLSDMTILHTTSARWVTATAPPGMPHLEARYGHTACFWGREMFIFGGCLLDPVGTRLYSNDVLSVSFELRPLLQQLPCTLAPDLGALVNNQGFFSDITFVVEGRKVYAHKCIMAARNEDFFKKMLMGPLRESSESVIPIPNMSYHVFIALLEYIYTGHVKAFRNAEREPVTPGPTVPPLPPPSSPPSASSSQESSAGQSATQLAADLLDAAHMYNMQPLERICCQRLVASMTPETLAAIWQLSVTYSIRSLRLVCVRYARSNIDLKTLPSLATDIPPDLADIFLSEVRYPF
jgi:hypothetical protein